jgi:hypothetical protein
MSGGAQPYGEMVTLNEFHERLSEKDAAGQASALRGGWLPDSPEVLTEAGVRCIPMLQGDNQELADAAEHRLEAIVFKLRHLPDDRAARGPLARFEELLAARKRRETSDMKMGFLLIGGLLALIVLVVYGVIYMVTR